MPGGCHGVAARWVLYQFEQCVSVSSAWKLLGMGHSLTQLLDGAPAAASWHSGALAGSTRKGVALEGLAGGAM